MTDAHATEKLRSQVEGQRFPMLTTTSTGGKLVSRPMTVQEFEGWVLRFIAQDDTEVTQESEGQEVNLAFIDGGSYVSLSGTGVVSRDVEKKRELWNRINEAYADDPEDPNNVILEIHVDSGEYWDSGSRVAQLVGLAKTLVTGERPGGDHDAADV